MTRKPISETDELKAGCLYRYDAGGWCKHGIALVTESKDGLVAFDTYWNAGRSEHASGDRSRIDLGSLIGADFLLDTNYARDVDRDVFDTHDEADRAFLPIGGMRERWLVDSRSDAVPERKAEQLRGQIADLESRVQSAIRDIVRKSIELNDVEKIIEEERAVRMSASVSGLVTR